MPPTRPRIAIIGGGPAGLTLGALLHKHSIPFTIFELRPQPSQSELSSPSGMLDLHAESGLAALQESNLYTCFLEQTGDCTEAQVVADQTGTVLFHDEGGQGDRPEISRHALISLLLDSVPEKQIRWSHKLLSAATSNSNSNMNKARESESGSEAGDTADTTTTAEMALTFGAEGGGVHSQTFDLVVGADGAWSKVRSSLLQPALTPAYAGIQCLTLTIRHVTTKYPALANLLGAGSFAALGTRHAVMAHRGPLESARLYVMLSSADEKFAVEAGLAGQTADAVKERVVGDEKMLGLWGPEMKALVRTACEEEAGDNPGKPVDLKPLYRLPVGNAWEHRVGATLIGDAAHLMCPWAGEGVNLAMWDALLLARAIVRAWETAEKDDVAFRTALDPLVREFEADLVERAGEKAQETLDNGEMMFGSEDAARAFAEFFASMGPPPE